MIYRKTPACAPKLLLAITYGVGAGALLGAAACSSSSGGSSPYNPCGVDFCGSVGIPEDASGTSPSADDAGVDAGMRVGLFPDDAGVETDSASDGTADAANPCGVVCGVSTIPQDASRDATGDE